MPRWPVPIKKPFNEALRTTSQVNIRMDGAQASNLDHLADKWDMTKNDVVNHLVQYALDQGFTMPPETPRK